MLTTTDADFVPSNDLTSSRGIRSNKFGGHYENGKSFTVEKWSEICSIYKELEQTKRRRPSRKELAKAAQVSENSARRAIRMVKTGSYKPIAEEAKKKLKKQNQKVNFERGIYLKLAEQDYRGDLLHLGIENMLLDSIQLQERIYNTLKSCDWKIILSPSPFFSMNMTKSLMKEFYHFSSSHASNFVSIVRIAANKYSNVSPPKLTFHKCPIDGILITRVECHTPQSKEGLTIDDYCTAMSIDLLETDLEANYLI